MDNLITDIEEMGLKADPGCLYLRCRICLDFDEERHS
jgi:hypothetical protein